jgi:hypothetical protein
VILQLMSAPVMTTIPVGIVPDPLTATLTATDWPDAEGSGVSAVMIVVLGKVIISVGEGVDVAVSVTVGVKVNVSVGVDTKWLSVSQLLS